jgi:hypothetical protein
MWPYMIYLDVDYGYYEWKRRNTELVWGIFGGLFLLNLMWSLYARQLIVSEAGNTSQLELSRQVLTLLSVLIAIAIYIYRDRIKWFCQGGSGVGRAGRHEGS